jgi:hypothetical protein
MGVVIVVMDGMGEPADKELACAGHIRSHVRVHGVLAQQVDAEFFACLGEAHHAVKGNDISEHAAAFVEVGHAEEL